MSLSAFGQTLTPDFVGRYGVRELAVPESIPSFEGSILFKASDPATLLVGSGSAEGDLYQIKVQRDVQGHISGFSGDAVWLSHAPGNPAAMDPNGLYSGLDYGPNGVLFYASFDASIGQIKSGSTDPSRFIAVSDLGLDTRLSGIGFVPAGFPGAGRLKLTGIHWYDTSARPDGSGTYDIPVPAVEVDLSAGAGFLYVSAGRPGFAKTSVLVAGDDQVRAYAVDANGDPLLETERVFISDFAMVLGAVVDPVTGDFIFSTGDVSHPRLVVVGGIVADGPVVTLTTPVDNARFRGPATFPLEATATESGGAIARVEFYQGSNLMISLVPPSAFSAQADSLKAGEYAFTAVAYDASGISSTSKVVHVTVFNDGPLVSLLYPQDNLSLAACSDLLVTAQVQAGNSEIASAEIRDGSAIQKSFGTVNTDQPLFARLVHLEEGVHEIAVQVTDANGIMAVARVTNLVVQPLALHRLVLHHYQLDELKFCFRGNEGSHYLWEQAGAVPASSWRPFLTNTAPAATYHWTNSFDRQSSSQYFQIRKLD